MTRRGFAKFLSDLITSHAIADSNPIVVTLPLRYREDFTDAQMEILKMHTDWHINFVDYIEFGTVTTLPRKSDGKIFTISTFRL